MTHSGEGPPAAGLSPASEQRLREMRSAVTAAVVVWGALFTFVTWDFNAWLASAILCVSGALVGVLLAWWSRMRRSARSLLGLGVACIVYVQLCFFLGGLAAVGLYAPPGVVAGVAVLALALAFVKLRGDLARFDAEWEQHRAANERDVLDLRAATYDVSRRFAPLTGGGRGVVMADTSTAFATAGRFTPVIAVAASVGAVTASHGWTDVRTIGIAVLSPGLAVALTSVLAQGLVHYGRLRGYERRLGRPILNR